MVMVVMLRGCCWILAYCHTLIIYVNTLAYLYPIWICLFN